MSENIIYSSIFAVASALTLLAVREYDSYKTLALFVVKYLRFFIAIYAGWHIGIKTFASEIANFTYGENGFSIQDKVNDMVLSPFNTLLVLLALIYFWSLIHLPKLLPKLVKNYTPN